MTEISTQRHGYPFSSYYFLVLLHRLDILCSTALVTKKPENRLQYQYLFTFLYCYFSTPFLPSPCKYKMILALNPGVAKLQRSCIIFWTCLFHRSVYTLVTGKRKELPILAKYLEGFLDDGPQFVLRLIVFVLYGLGREGLDKGK